MPQYIVKQLCRTQKFGQPEELVEQDTIIEVPEGEKPPKGARLHKPEKDDKADTGSKK